MRRRPSPRGPTLALAGGGPVAALHAMAARTAGVEITSVSAASDDPTATTVASGLGLEVTEAGSPPVPADAVVVVGDLSERAAAALAAASTHRRVLVEAPLAATLAAADTLVAAAATERLDIRYGENLLWAPAVRAALAATSRIGQLSFLEARALRPRPPDEHLPDARSGGALFDVGVHPLALVLAAAADDVVEVRAELHFPPGTDLDDAGVVELSFASGATARIEASWRTVEPVWDLQAASDVGVVRLELFPEPVLELDGDPIVLAPAARGTDPVLLELGYVDQLVALVTADPVAPPTASLGLGRRVLEVVCAAYRSAGSGGRPEALPFAGPRDLTPHELWSAARST